MAFAWTWRFLSTASIRVVEQWVGISNGVGVVVTFECGGKVKVHVSLSDAHQGEGGKYFGVHVER